MGVSKDRYSDIGYKRNKKHERHRYYDRVEPTVVGKYNEREDEVVLNEELSLLEIAEKLGRSIKSVESRRHYLRKKQNESVAEN